MSSTSPGNGRSNRGAQGQPRRCDVSRQRPAGLHRQAQEPEGWQRHRTRHQAVAALRDGDAGTDRRAAALQRHASPRLLVRRTWNATRRFFARWKQTPDEAYRFAVQSFFERTDFLRTLQHWILFYVEDSETKKSVLRQHQRRAIDAIIERCADPSKDRGLIWHTQGSGKTFTLLTAARLILEQKERFQNPTVIIVVDRTELEGQMKGWVDKLLGEMQNKDIATWRARV
jgi:type I site-specific restriction endonuclease